MSYAAQLTPHLKPGRAGLHNRRATRAVLVLFDHFRDSLSALVEIARGKIDVVNVEQDPSLTSSFP
ncbi:MAG: hypothetical protein CMA63_06800 [Euryarchaeota archaeon]|nr:hypothetical protein [Euryarchaeota archaeon]